jgi:hypothetical protein
MRFQGGHTTMARFLSHITAASRWPIPFLETVLEKEIANSAGVDYTVTSFSERYRKKDCNIHLCRTNLPPSAILKTGNDWIASPELVFLQLASELDIHRLILLGLQLCAHPPGRKADAVTTKKKLNLFLQKTAGHKGRKQACRAARYIENGSASIMESIVYMLLTLPHALGGYGLSGAAFNAEIALPYTAANRLEQSNCFVDMYYKSAKLAIEYDSFAFHSRPSEQGKDAIRSEILRRCGVEMMHLKTIQVYDKDASLDFALNLARKLGKNIIIRTAQFDKMHRQLRALLPSVSSSFES